MFTIVNEQESNKIDIESDISDIQKITSSTVSSEHLDKEFSEQFKIAIEILAKQKEEAESKILTNPSAIALETPRANTGEGISRVKKTPRQLFNLYLTNPLVARAINISSDTLVSKGYDIIGDDKVGVEACKSLIENSGGINLFWQLATNTEIAGNGFLEKIYDLKGTKILRLKHVHPITMEFKKDLSTNKIIVGKDGEPIAYSQYYTDSSGIEKFKDVPKENIEHLKFNCLGDEFEGLSAIQPGYDTIVRLMNMEYSAAEAAIKTANPLIVGKCNTKSPSQIAMWGTILGRINGRDQIFIPQDMDIEFKSPGAQNFSDYADYFVNIVVSTFGVPKSVLLGGGDSGSGNRAESIVLSRHFYSVVRRKQQYMQEFFKRIFEEYSELDGFKAPELYFDDIAEDAGLMTDSAIKLLGAGIISIQEARDMIGLDEDFQPGEGPVDKQETKQTNTSTSTGPGVSNEIKKSNMDVAFPEEPGKKSGSQSGIKKKQKAINSLN